MCCRTRYAAERMIEHKIRGVAVMRSEIGVRLIPGLASRKIALTSRDLPPVNAYMSKP
jgi:hypothetical protein